MILGCGFGRQCVAGSYGERVTQTLSLAIAAMIKDENLPDTSQGLESGCVCKEAARAARSAEFEIG
jgi:hypothetical protein